MKKLAVLCAVRGILMCDSKNRKRNRRARVTRNIYQQYDSSLARRLGAVTVGVRFLAKGEGVYS
jgi:hypothetical protein